MTKEGRILFWGLGIVVTGILVHLLSEILLPFVAGMAVAYFLDPLADRLEARGLSRTMATTVITVVFFAVVVGVIIVLFPLLQTQVLHLVKLVPDVIAKLRALVEPYLQDIRAGIGQDEVRDLQGAAGQYAGKVLQWVSGFLTKLWSGGIAFVSLMSLVLVTPVVAFYLLREWDHIVAWIDSCLPRDAAPTIREQARAIDRTLAGFVRGQSSVCLVLATTYGVGLTLVGLNSGLLVGLGAGFISFIPYLGAAVGMTVGLAIAFFQFGPAEWPTIAAVAGIFLFGQTMESYVLTPRLVGGRVGLHPLWIIFALMAGGALFGFTGVLLAVPTAAVIGVLIRFAIDRYKGSPLYAGNGEAADEADPEGAGDESR